MRLRKSAYTVSSGPAWATERDSISKTKQKTKQQNNPERENKEKARGSMVATPVMWQRQADYPKLEISCPTQQDSESTAIEAPRLRIRLPHPPI